MDDNETQDDYPFAALQDVMRAFMRTHPHGKQLKFFKQLWDLYGDYHMEVEYHGGKEFEAEVLTYLHNNQP